MHTLEIDGVNSGYNGKPVLHNIQFKAEESAIYVVLGPNGAGKTTLFRTIAGILEPYSGQVLFDGQNVTHSKEIRKRINYLSHYNAIPEEMTVYDTLKFYADIEGGNPDEVVSLLNLGELKEKKVSGSLAGAKEAGLDCQGFLEGEGSLSPGRADDQPRPWRVEGNPGHSPSPRKR